MEHHSSKKSILPANRRLSQLATGATLVCAMLAANAASSDAFAGSLKNSVVQTAQQKKEIKGRVTDRNGEPLIGVTIAEKGTQNRAITDVDGYYTINVESAAPVLEVSYVGYTAKSVAVNNRSNIDITLEEDLKTLGEVVVQGFGLAQKKESLTGAISSIGDKDISRTLATTTSGALVGKIAGINSRQADGRPGASTSLQIRNMGTPLYVIDGIVKDEGQFNNLDVNDIEQVSVLKDASAALYGVRAANGVVVVTTKHGRVNDKPSIQVNGYYGWQNNSRMAKPADIGTYMRAYTAAQTVQGADLTYSREDYAKWMQGKEDGYRPFDWYKYIWVTSPQTYINVNTSGGSEKINYYFSLGHLKQDAAIRNYGGFSRTNVQMSVDARITKKFTVGASMNGRIETRQQPGVPGCRSSPSTATFPPSGPSPTTTRNIRRRCRRRLTPTSDCSTTPCRASSRRGGAWLSSTRTPTTSSCPDSRRSGSWATIWLTSSSTTTSTHGSSTAMTRKTTATMSPTR